MFSQPLVFLLGLSSVTRAAVSLEAPADLTKGASDPVSRSWLGWAFESSSFPDFSQPFSQNIFADFAERTGGDIMIRLGGTSMDHSIMNLSQEQAVFRPEPNENLRSPIIFGRKYFDAFERFSNKAKFTIQAPMANQSTKANAIAFVAQCVKRMGVEMIEAIELGNEPDLYETQNIRDPPYLPRDFAIETANHIKSLEAGIPNLPQGRIFQVFEKSSQMADDKPQWQYADRFINHLEDVTDMNRIKSVAFHYYQGKAGDGIQSTLLTPTHTASMSDQYFKNSLRFLREEHRFLDFVIDEIGSALGNRNTPPDYDLSASVGTSIWTVDWMLNAMAMNVSRIHMQQGRNFAISAWRPTEQPYVQGGFYGHALVADFIGLGDGELRVRKLKAATQQSPMVTAYAGFNAGKLSKIALTNQQYFQGTDRPESEKVRIHLGGVSDNLTVATVRRITSLTGDAHEDILYAGLDWRAENAGKPALVNDTNIAIPIIDGEMEFELPAMEAWLINW